MTTTITNTDLIIIIIIIMSKIQFLLYIHKKDLFLFPHSNRSNNQYHYLSKILFFSNPSQPNHSSLLRTTRCGILFNHRITAF